MSRYDWLWQSHALVVVLLLSNVGCGQTPQQAEFDPLPDRLVVATWNLEWFFDDYTGDNRTDLARRQSAPSAAAWRWKVARSAEVIAALNADIVALQEVENRKVLADLVNELSRRHNRAYRVAWAEGTDVATEQDVAILYLNGLVAYGRREQSQVMWESRHYYNLSKHLWAEFAWQGPDGPVRLYLFTAHFRSLPEQEPIRIRQARLLHRWVTPWLEQNQPVVVLGDWNTEVRVGEPLAGRDLGVLCGWETPSPEDDLVDTLVAVNENERSTHLSGAQYDRILVSRPLAGMAPQPAAWVWRSTAVRRDLVVQGQGPDGEEHYSNYYGIAPAERDISDHYPVVIVLERP
ncbi:MAG: endonuclease [Pirellulaceae bacterium]|nr:MAG: endonuclease [Pirellulaceae bacterium]